MHDSVYEVIDKLHRAIAAKRKFPLIIGAGIQMSMKKYGKIFAKCIVNPCVLSWDNGNYFLAVYSNEAEDFMYYRVDKMSEVTILKTACNFTNMKKTQMLVYIQRNAFWYAYRKSPQGGVIF